MSIDLCHELNSCVVHLEGDPAVVVITCLCQGWPPLTPTSSSQVHIFQAEPSVQGYIIQLILPSSLMLSNHPISQSSSDDTMSSNLIREVCPVLLYSCNW